MAKIHIRGQRLYDAHGDLLRIAEQWSACGQTNNPDLLTICAEQVTCKRCRKTRTFDEASA